MRLSVSRVMSSCSEASFDQPRHCAWIADLNNLLISAYWCMEQSVALSAGLLSCAASQSAQHSRVHLGEAGRTLMQVRASRTGSAPPLRGSLDCGTFAACSAPGVVQISEGLDVLAAIDAAFVDAAGRPLQNVRIRHTIVLDDPFDDPQQLAEHIPDASPAPAHEQARQTGCSQ